MRKDLLIVVAGAQPQRAAGFLREILAAAEIKAEVVEGIDIAVKPEIAVLLDATPEQEKLYRRFLRNLPFGMGLVVGYGRSGPLRKATRGFKYRFRWYDEQRLWTGLRLPKEQQLDATAAARVAHELGAVQATILATLNAHGR